MPSGAIILRLNPGKSRRCACLGEPVCVRDVRVPGLRWRSSRQGEPGAFAPGTKTCGATSGGCGACHPLADAASRRCAPAPARGSPSAALPGPAPRPAWSGAPQRPVRHCTPPPACSGAGALTHRRLAGGSGWGHCFTCIFLLNYHIPS